MGQLASLAQSCWPGIPGIIKSVSITANGPLAFSFPSPSGRGWLFRRCSHPVQGKGHHRQDGFVIVNNQDLLGRHIRVGSMQQWALNADAYFTSS
jgi:hypothetical protein